MLRGIAAAIGLLLTSAGLALGQQPNPGPEPIKKAAVTAVNLGTIYLAAGRNDGIREGTIVRVRRLGIGGEYRVAFLSSKSAAARGDSTAAIPQVGDSVEYQPVVEKAVGPAPAGAPSAAAARAAWSVTAAA